MLFLITRVESDRVYPGISIGGMSYEQESPEYGSTCGYSVNEQMVSTNGVELVAGISSMRVNERVANHDGIFRIASGKSEDRVAPNGGFTYRESGESNCDCPEEDTNAFRGESLAESDHESHMSHI